MNILNLIGAPDSHNARVVWNNGDPSRLKVTFSGSNTFISMLLPGEDTVATATFGSRQPGKVTLPPADIIMNSICDPDTNAIALKEAGAALQRTTVPVINPPEKILATTRDSIYNLLRDIPGVRVPKTVRIAPLNAADVHRLAEANGLAYPFIFRSAGDHGGAGMILVENRDERQSLESFAFDGRDFYAIEFIDSRAEDMHYRKARIMVIGGKAYVRHLIISDSWMVHAKDRRSLMGSDEALRREEEAFVNHPPETIDEQCFNIYKALGLDVFGMDCYVDEAGTMLIFEVNACMNTSYGNRSSSDLEMYDYLTASSERIRKAFGALLIQKAESGKTS
jgi:glutathione synthase/RimK-type ligase-like ATP-grasp enzyme